MIRIRELVEQDVPYMLEWMHDPQINMYFAKDMSLMSQKDVRNFCACSSHEKDLINGDSLHYAIVDNDDVYLGTVSLKDINFLDSNAEYAISTRKSAWGKGVALKATELILDVAFQKLQLHKVYLNVLENNYRAIRFYEKFGFIYEGISREHLIKDGCYQSLKWYSILAQEYIQSKGVVR